MANLTLLDSWGTSLLSHVVLSNELLDLICCYFVEDFCVQVPKRVVRGPLASCRPCLAAVSGSAGLAGECSLLLHVSESEGLRIFL